MAVDSGKVAINPRGAYSSTTTYERLDVVTYQSNTYVALQTTLGNLPTDTSSWMPWVKIDNASMSVRGLVKVDGTSITADADGTIHGHAAAGVNSFNGRDGDVLPEYGDYDAEQISYDNTDSGLTSNRAQGAIDELAPKKIITSDDAFDPTKTYAAGDWFIYQGVLYEVITACTGVTPPDATYYNPITLHELKNRIDTLNTRLNYPTANQRLLVSFNVSEIGTVRRSLLDRNSNISGMIIVVCQWGGGTVDLIFSILSITKHVYLLNNNISNPDQYYTCAYDASTKEVVITNTTTTRYSRYDVYIL